jgi:hypothetical protein
MVLPWYLVTLVQNYTEGHHKGRDEIAIPWGQNPTNPREGQFVPLGGRAGQGDWFARKFLALLKITRRLDYFGPWVFSGAGIVVFAAIWSVVTTVVIKLWPKREAAAPTVPATPKPRPNLCIEATKIEKISLENDTWTLRNPKSHIWPYRAQCATVLATGRRSVDALATSRLELFVGSLFHHLGIVPDAGGLVALLVVDGLVIAAVLSLVRPDFICSKVAITYCPRRRRCRQLGHGCD